MGELTSTLLLIRRKDPSGGSALAVWQVTNFDWLLAAAFATTRWMGLPEIPKLGRAARSMALRSGACFGEGRARENDGLASACSDRQNSKADSYPMKMPMVRAYHVDLTAVEPRSVRFLTRIGIGPSW